METILFVKETDGKPIIYVCIYKVSKVIYIYKLFTVLKVNWLLLTFSFSQYNTAFAIIWSVIFSYDG